MGAGCPNCCIGFWLQRAYREQAAPCLPCRSAVTALCTACIILHSGDAAEAGTASKHDQGQTCHAWSAPPTLSPERLLLELDLRPNRLSDKVK